MKIKLLTEGAKVPTKGTDGAAGYDLYADMTGVNSHVFVEHNKLTEVNTGVAISIPEGYVGIIKPRSGLAFIEGVNTLAGVIDSDYTGHVKLLLTSHGCGTYTRVKHQIRIAQLLIIPVASFDFEVVDTLEDTERGEGGFGSTGVN